MSAKNFVIVGGSHGMGQGIVNRLVAAGHQVTVLSRTTGDLETSDQIQHVVFDAVADEVDPSVLPETIHGLAYCPGSINLKSFRALDLDVYRSDFELNVLGALKVIKASVSGLKKAGKVDSQPNSPGSILLFSTVAVGTGMKMHASIAASKGAIEGLTRTLAAELAPDVRVNCIAPALTETPLTEKFFSSPEKAAALGDRYPLKRTGTVDDMAGLGNFLLAGESNWITGQVIGVDGGMGNLG